MATDRKEQISNHDGHKKKKSTVQNQNLISAKKDQNNSISSQLGKQERQPQQDEVNIRPTKKGPCKPTTNNKSVDHFIGSSSGKDLRRFQEDYDQITITYLTHLQDTRQCLNYVFKSGITEQFKNQLRWLNVLANLFHCPALFISPAPAEMDSSHFICGVLYNNQLLFINPLGIRFNKDTLNCLSEISDSNKAAFVVSRLYLSNDIIQKDPDGQSSCGPICVEVLKEINQHLDQVISHFDQWSKLPQEKGKNHDELLYYQVSIHEFGVPIQLVEVTKETNQGVMEKIREDHSNSLELLPLQQLSANSHQVNGLTIEEQNRFLEEKITNAAEQVLVWKLSADQLRLDHLENEAAYKVIKRRFERVEEKSSGEMQNNKKPQKRASDSNLTSKQNVQEKRERKIVSTEKSRIDQKNPSKSRVTTNQGQESASDFSSFDESLQEYKFEEDYFDSKKPPFKILDGEAGSLSSESSEESNQFEPTKLESNNSSDKKKPGYVVSIPTVAEGSNVPIINKIKNILNPEAFYDSPNKSLQESKNRLKINIGLNRMKSISKRKNKLLQKSVESVDREIYGSKQIRRFGFFWRPKWFDTVKNEKAQIGKVRAWYQQVKKKDPEQAEHLLDQLEIKPNPKMVPYTKIREKIKNHQNTQSQIKQMRTKKNINHVYFCSFDDDFEQLRYSEQGLFSEYDRLISDHESENGHPPHVVSTGYLVMSPQNPIIEVGVKLDMVVREATSRYFKNGIYYPEPNTMIYVKPEQDKIEASFLPKKNKNGNSCKNEMPNLLSDLVQKRKLNPNKSFVFNPTQAPLVTKMPNRMLFHRKKPKSIKMFDGIKSKNAKLLRYSFHDLQILIETQQSHVNSRDWANMIVDKCLIIPKSRDIEGITLSSIEIRGCLKSLVPRIFTYFNPIYTAHTRFKDNVTIDGKMSNYIYHLENTLINYETTLELKPYIPASSQNRDKLKNPNLITLRKKMDALTDFGTLLTYIANLLNDSIMAETIKKAAQSAGLAIVKELSTSLSFDYPKIVYAMLTDLLEKIDGGPCLDYQELGKLTIDVLESLADNSFFNTYEKYTLDKLNEISLDYGLNLLHISALSGNKAAVKFLIGKGMSLRCTTRDDDIIAIHFAIKYCAEQGDDLELIKLCVSADLYSQPLELCLNMLEMAITTLDNPLTVVRILCEHGAMRPELREPLYQVIQKAQPRELLYPLLACIHYQPENCELALEMIENGCNIDEVGIIESTTNEDDSYSITPLFECISRANLRLLKVILDQGAKVIEVYDHYDRTPLLATLDHSDNYSMIIIQLLLEYGAELDDCDNREYTCLIHELISPVLSCFVEPDPVRDNFLAAFPDTVRQLRITPPPENDLFDYVLRESTPHYLDIQDGADNTPLDVALEAKNVETVEKLISAGSSTDHLEREDFEYIRKFTYHTDLYQSNEEEMAEEEKRELAEEALAAEGVSLLNPDDPKEFMEIYKALTLYDIESPEDIIEDLYERAKKVDCEEQISSARSSSSLNDRDKKRHCPSPNPTDFKYDDEEDPDAEEEDYPDTPPKSDSSSPIQSDDDDSYEMSYNSN